MVEGRGRRMRYRLRWWTAALRAALLIPVVGVGVRTVGVRRTLRWAGRGPSDLVEPAPGSPVPGRVTEIASAVGVVARTPPFRARCVTRSLVLVWLLRRELHPARMVVGLGAAGRPLLPGHAWVEYAGQPINDGADVRERYQPLGSTDAADSLGLRQIRGRSPRVGSVPP